MTSDGNKIGHDVYMVRNLMDRDNIGPEEALQKLSAVIAKDDRQLILDRIKRQSPTLIELVGPMELSELGGPRSWFHDYNPANGYYWKRQRLHLINVHGRLPLEIEDLDKSSNRVLSHLEDPNYSDPFLIKGLVVGYVQSGKTANFSALIAKAADAGYKIIIVLSGLHNTLRQQTQRRLEQDLGREAGVGVDLPEIGKQWVWVTGSKIEDDFTADRAGVDPAILQGNEQVIFVVKKNKSRLDRLINWMEGRVSAPVLIIDDEGDQASINTGGNRQLLEISDVDLDVTEFDGSPPDSDEISPSAINAAVRRLIGQFEQCAYVAYTATPFANALIDPNAIDVEAGGDLFPRDFILVLPPPISSEYVGPEKLFGRDRLPGDPDDAELDGFDQLLIKIVPDYETCHVIPPTSNEQEVFEPSIPPSLDDALIDFILASAARLHREEDDVTCTMLIHTDRHKAVQNSLAVKIHERLSEISQDWKYDVEGTFRQSLATRWDREFTPVTSSLDISLVVQFEQLTEYIDRLFRDSSLAVLVLNSTTDDELDFDIMPNQKAIVIGGNKLSRGLTIEDLLVSYYVRESLYYDTLMQMGRWFGYRGRYVDLTRLYSTHELVYRFRGLATIEEELRNHIAIYESRGLKPTDIPIKIRKHPIMQVTVPSKMRDAHDIAFSYDGTLLQTLHFSFDDIDQLNYNLDATRNFLRSLGEPDWDHKRPHWLDVDPHKVLHYIREYRIHPEDDRIHPPSVREYILDQMRQRELITWRVLVCAAYVHDPVLGYEDLGVLDEPDIALIGRSRLIIPSTSCGVITDPRDEKHGLSDDQISQAKEIADQSSHMKLAHAYRQQRRSEEGLLLIYPISKYSKPRRHSTGRRSRRQPLFEDPAQGVTVVGYAISFPYSDSSATHEYVEGRRYRP